MESSMESSFATNALDAPEARGCSDVDRRIHVSVQSVLTSTVAAGLLPNQASDLRTPQRLTLG